MSARLGERKAKAVSRPNSSASPRTRRPRLREEEPATYGTGAPSDEERAVLARAEKILEARFAREGEIIDPESGARFLRMRLAHLDHEEFHAIWLDNKHRVLGVEQLSSGTIDSAMIYVREVVRSAMRINAAAVVFAHNHPSGDATPSAVDRAITHRLRDALALVDVRLVDHFVIGAGVPTSMAKKGWI